MGSLYIIFDVLILWGWFGYMTSFFFLMNGYLNLILCWIFINVYLKCKSKIELKKNRNVNPVISNLCLYDVEQEDACNVNYYATWTP